MATPMGPGEMAEAIVKNLKEKTGKDLQEWVDLVQQKGPAGEKEQIAWLRNIYGLGKPTASVIVSEIEGEGMTQSYVDPDKLLDDMYAGDREPLRPIYEELRIFGKTLGEDVRFGVGKTYVAMSHDRQFAVIKPESGRVELGLALGDAAPTERLEANGPNGTTSKITHKVRLTEPAHIDDDVRSWLKDAYERNATPKQKAETEE